MRVLVTGAAGFIGFNVSRLLLARGDTVIGVDCVNDYYDPRLKEARLAVLREEFEAPDEALRVDIHTLLAELGAKGLVGPEAGADDSYDGDAASPTAGTRQP